jgi:hypothetical protein
MSKPLRVLIVEDFENDTALLILELRRGGFDPHYERIETADATTAALTGEQWDS